MRKESGFEVSDKIHLHVSGNEMLENIIKKFEDQIKRDTLAIEIVYNSEKATTEVKVNGEKLLLEVVKAQ